jgi:D-alanine-D-alanine ligase
MFAEDSDHKDVDSGNAVKENAQVDPEWWRHIFDRIYLLTDARSIGDEQITRAESDLMEKYLQVSKNEPILDLCSGQGRHALELARRGYTRINAVDYSEYLLVLGKSRNDSRVSFIRGDARSLPFNSNSYKAVAVMACSFGYFPDDKENETILREAHRVLTPGGILLIDLADGDKTRKQMVKSSWHEADKGVFVLRRRKPQSGGIAVRELVISSRKGLIRESYYFEKLYSANRIRELVSGAGLRQARVHRGLNKLCGDQDLGFMSNRMLVTARKL